jgi:hypothetical protein
MSKEKKSMERLSCEFFESLKGQSVQVYDRDGTSTELRVDTVSPGPLHGEQWEAFSVSLTGPGDVHLPQGNYRIQHPAIGEMVLLVIPNSPVHYQIVVTRKREAVPA